MVKKVIIRIVIIVAIVLVSASGYFFVIDRQSNVPDNLDLIIDIKTEHFMGRKVFKLSPKQDIIELQNTINDDLQEKNTQNSYVLNNTEQLSDLSNKVIIYFHGGSYIAEMTNNHWNFLTALVNRTKATVFVPDYPLAPKATYQNVLNMIEPFYIDTINKFGTENVIVMGDSAGGGMALGLLERMTEKNIKQPSKTVLISPWLDVSMSNQEIDKVNDSKLNKNNLCMAGIAYSRGINKEDEYFVSPVKGNLTKLKNVTIFIGNKDMLCPDCYLLQEKARQVGVEIEVKEYENADHIWIIDNNDVLSQNAYQDLVETLIH